MQKRTILQAIVVLAVAGLVVGSASANGYGPNLALYNVDPFATATSDSNQTAHGGDGYTGGIDGDPGTIWHGWNTGNPPGSKAWWEMSWTGGAQSFDRVVLLSSRSEADDHHGAAGEIGDFQLFLDGGATPVMFDGGSTTAGGSGTYDLMSTETATTIRMEWSTVAAGGHHAIINEFEVYAAQAAPIPEPLTACAMAAGLAGLAGYVRRRRAARA
jgi:hypothetical protein